MTETLASLSHKLSGASDLQAVVRSMKALAAASIGQYEKSVLALADYDHTIELGLSVCFKGHRAATWHPAAAKGAATSLTAIVFGSDQGLVGQFNDVLAEFVSTALAPLRCAKRVWAVGERVHARLQDAGLTPVGLLPVATSVATIAPLVGRLLVACGMPHEREPGAKLYIFHQRTVGHVAYAPVSQTLLPLTAAWAGRLVRLPWPTPRLPEIVGDQQKTLQGLINEFLFVSLFKACAESLAAENASRLAAMQRAEKNIDELAASLNQRLRQVRQTSIDEELFDVLSGYESLARPLR